VILLDTNVFSALMQRTANPEVIGWLDAQPPESIWTTAATVFEVWLGLAILPDGRRRRRLQGAFARTMQEDFDGRVLPFDSAAAQASAAIAARQRLAGRPVEIRDVQIAGIAAARKATLATRNTRHFEELGVPIVNPWETKRLR
jgi:predicted nucleic acid-binding protein